MPARIDTCVSSEVLRHFLEVLGSFGEVARQMFTAFCLVLLGQFIEGID